MKVKVHELRNKSKADLQKQLEELKKVSANVPSLRQALAAKEAQYLELQTAATALKEKFEKALEHNAARVRDKQKLLSMSADSRVQLFKTEHLVRTS